MCRFLLVLLWASCVASIASQAQEPKIAGHYLFAWTGDLNHAGNDFLAVINADPESASYGRLVTTVATDQQTIRIHHTEYVMPASGMLFANDHDAGRTFIFDVRDPLHPKIVTSFTGWDRQTHRLVVTGREPRLYLVKFDQTTGSLSMDEDFHDEHGKPGFDMADRDWPHVWRGSGQPHGVVFSR